MADLTSTGARVADGVRRALAGGNNGNGANQGTNGNGANPSTSPSSMSLSRRGPNSPAVGEIRSTITTDQVVPAPNGGYSAGNGNSLTAAASVMTAAKMRRTRGRTSTTDRDWQDESWRYYGITPELAYVTRFEAAAMSRAVLTAARLPDDPQAAPEIVTDPTHPAHMGMAEFLGGRQNASQEIARIDTHMTVPGETWIVAFDDPDTRLRRWAVLSNAEVSYMGGDRWTLTIDGEETQFDDAEVIMIRVWNMDGRERWKPDSPVHHLLPVLSELEGLTKHVSATIDSRLAGAGILFAPSEMTFPQPDDEAPEGVDDFTWALIRTAQTSIADRDSASALVPLVVRAAGEMIGNIEHLKFWTELDEQAKPLREEAIRRIALGLDIPPEVLLGMSDANHWCFDDKTEVYSDSGWISHDDVVIGETQLLTLDKSTGTSEWATATDLYTADVVDEPMLSIEGRCHSSLTTLDHSWPVETTSRPRDPDDSSKRLAVTSTTTIKSRDLLADQRSTPSRPAMILGVRHNLPTEPKFDDDLVRLVAWASTDADLHHDTNVRIRQSRPDHVEEIDGILSRLFPTSHTRTRDESAGVESFFLNNDAQSALSEHGGPCPTSPTHWIASLDFVDQLTGSQLRLFIDTAIKANGDDRNNLYAVDETRLDPFERAGILLGDHISRGRRNQRTGFGDEPVAWLSFGSRDRFTPTQDHMGEVAYTGTIWCPTVEPHHTVLARRNGKVFWTGQTSWQIEESSIKLHMEPKLQTICHAATTGWLQPYLRSLNVSDWDRYIAWYDVTQIKLRPNRSTDAKDLHDDVLISDDARLQAAGFDENDKPDSAQYAEQLLQKLVVSQPQLAGGILPILFPDQDWSALELVTPGGGGEDNDEAMDGVSNAPVTEADTTDPESRERDSRVAPETVDRN